MKIIFFIVLALLSISINAQTILFEKDLKIKSTLEVNNIFSIKSVVDSESLPIIRYPNDKLTMLLLNQKDFYAFEFDKNHDIEKRFQFSRIGFIWKDLLGFSIDNEDYNIFFTNTKKDRIYIVEFNIDTKKTSQHFFYFKPKEEKFVGALSYKNKFFIISVMNKSSILNIYEFENWENYKVKEIDFTGKKFTNSKYGFLSEVLNDDPLVTLESDIPNSLEITSSVNKIYFFKNELSITLDHLVSQTIVIDIKLEDYTATIRSLNQGIISFEDISNVKSNSYLNEGKLIQIKSSKEELFLSARDFYSGEMLKEYRVKSKEDIAFKNRMMIQEGGLTGVSQGNIIVIEKTKTFLKKITHGKVGVSGFSNNELTTLTIGGFEEIQQNNGNGIMTPTYSTISTPYGSQTITSYNHTMSGFSGYSGGMNKRSIYFKGLFEKNTFEHKKGSLDANPFDKIKSYLASMDNNVFSQTIFKVNDYFVLGYYNKAEEKYYLRKFD